MALPPTLLQEKNNPFHIDAARCDGSDYPQDPTIPRDNGSPGDTPPRPSRFPTVSARDVEVQGIANMALPPTPNNQQQKPFPIDAVRFPIDPNDALTDKASAKARQMKGLKRKQKFPRTLEAPSSTNQKTTNFDYAVFRKENEMRANENARQVRAAIALAKARSPLSKIKRDRTVLRASLGASAKKQRILTAKCHLGQEKITNLKQINNQLMVNML
jgi:hypothetical protein